MTQKLKLRIPRIYVTSVVLLGFIVFFLFGDISFQSLSHWVLGYALTGSVFLLAYYNILLPPEGNSLSMDSAVYLACIFVFGLETTLTVLFFSSVISFFFNRSDTWWIHIFNFSIYTMMIASSYYSFIFLGGEAGTVNSSQIVPYIVSLSIYFIFNVLFIGFFFFLKEKSSLITILKGTVKGILESYLSTLLLAIVLSFLLESQPFIGLFLFIGISLLLSFTFRQHFKLYKEASAKANKDHLTGLNNHGYFKEILAGKIDEVKETNENLSLAMIDIDDFKKYNDGFGHLQGDKLLTFFGAQLAESCSSRGYTVARYGGEEFVILMPRTSEMEASSFIDCLRKNVNDTYFEGVELLPYGCLSFSAGITQYKKEITSSSEFLSNADEAMYYAKSQGKNNTHIFGKELQTINIDQPVEEIEQQIRLFIGKDIYTYRHSKRVFKYAVEFCKVIPLKESEMTNLMLGALIHDIGKLEIPRHVINKKEKLTPNEWEMVKQHVTWGRDIVSTNNKFKNLIPLVELHHERYDGNGYPHGLKGEQIPKLARILCIIDSFDAMTTERPYQKTKTFEEAIVELNKCSGSQFDPNYVKPFINYIEDKYIGEKEIDVS